MAADGRTAGGTRQGTDFIEPLPEGCPVSWSPGCVGVKPPTSKCRPRGAEWAATRSWPPVRHPRRGRAHHQLHHATTPIFPTCRRRRRETA
jgi:hypothetical protein